MRRPWGIGRTSLKLDLYASNRKLSCFSETREQNHKSYSQNKHKGEKFDLRQHPKAKFLLLQNQRTGTRLGPDCRSPFWNNGSAVPEELLLKSPSPHLIINGWVPKPFSENLPCSNALTLKAWPNPRSGKMQMWTIPPVSLPADLEIRSFLKSCAIVLAAVPTG